MARRQTKQELPDDFEEHILDIDVGDEMRASFLEYAYSVIYSRALPDARDGLKPVQRRILYTMDQMGLRPDRGHVKSARVVGEVMGRLHPHGDSAIYDALVRMSQPWSMRVPMIDGHGNFGSPDDSPAAMRYTECRMAPAAVAMTASIDEDTVDFKPNYDSRETEPTVLPVGDPQPDRQRHHRHRGRHGHQHRAAQPDRGRPGAAPPDQPPQHRRRRPDAVHPRPRPAHRRQDRRPRRHPRRLRDRPRHLPDAGHRPGRDRSAAARASSSPSCPTASAPRRSSSGSRSWSRARSSRASPTSRTSPTASKGLRLVIEVKNGFHPEALLEQLYKHDADGGHLRHQHRRPRRRPAAHPRPQGAARGLPRPPLRRRTPPLVVPPRQGRRPAAPRRRPDRRDPRHRRGDPADPRPATTPRWPASG